MHDFDLLGFWENSAYAKEQYVGAPLTDAMVRFAQAELGYRLPQAYIELLRNQNGGIPVRTNHRTPWPTSWAEDHIAITGIHGLDTNKPYSLCGEIGSKFMIEEWGYPDIGIYFADCPSAGHDMLCLDYSECGVDGEPRVVHVDQELEYAVTPVAENIEAFIRGLEDDSAFE